MENYSHISTGAVPKPKCIDIQKEVKHIDTLTSTYLNALNQEVEKNEYEQNKLTTEIRKMLDTIDQLKRLAEQPEWPDSFIQVNPLAYIPATINHTGEYYVRLGPETYSLMSLKEALGFLQRKVDQANKALEVYKEQQRQLQKRNVFSTERNLLTADTEGMPLEIVSNKGVAHKTASGFYEVLEEYDEKEENEFYKNRQNRIKRGKQKKQVDEEIENIFDKLDELQKQEDLRGELEVENVDAATSINRNTDIPERVKLIVKQSGLYKMLLNDSVIQKHCFTNKSALKTENNAAAALCNKSVLNELIVEALINVPNYTDELNDDISDCGDKTDHDFHENISKKDLVVSEFLDSIENNIKQWSL